jgi:hypothetical protein
MSKSSKSTSARVAKPVPGLPAVTPIKQFATPLDARSSAYVEDLIKLLDLARRGKLDAFIWAGSRINDDGDHYLFYSPRNLETEDPVSSLGVLEVMKRELLQRVHQ